MKIDFETYQQDNGHFGVCVTIEREGSLPLCFTNNTNKKEEIEAVEETIKQSVWMALLK